MAAGTTNPSDGARPPDERPGDDVRADQAAADPGAASPEEAGGDAAGTGRGSLREQLAAALAERGANRESWLRAQAELENYRKRVQREMDEARRYQVLPLARDVLPVLDNLRRAIAAAEEGGDPSGLVEGVRLVLQQFEDILARHHVTPIEAVGQPFDPNLHEALQQVPAPGVPPMTVVEEFQRGYRLHDRVLRPSQVVVSQ
ncbi:MAG TPA: nucleotide exchange factor GrpE [Planctomycetaceae bacterium]|nr:nucleotide exchange factor GrpE [Planctomycetaceae bacterium]